MSVKIMGLVWDLSLAPNKKFVLLAYADHANHDGGNIWPSIITIVKKTCYHERSVQRVTRELQKEGYLVIDGKGPKGTSKWRIPLNQGGDKITPLANCANTSGDIPSGDKMPPEGIEPSLKDVEKRTGFLARLYTENIGPLTPLMADIIRNAAIDYPDESWYEPAFKIAVCNNARKWNYVEAILDGWKRNGFGWKPSNGKKGKTNGKTSNNKPNYDDGFMEEYRAIQERARKENEREAQLPA